MSRNRCSWGRTSARRKIPDSALSCFGWILPPRWWGHQQYKEFFDCTQKLVAVSEARRTMSAVV